MMSRCCLLCGILASIFVGPASQHVDDLVGLLQGRVEAELEAGSPILDPDADPGEDPDFQAGEGPQPSSEMDDQLAAEADAPIGEEYEAEGSEARHRSSKDEKALQLLASSFNFTKGSIVWVAGKKCSVVWDGRPEHEFVKVKWLEGREIGKTSGIIPIDDVAGAQPANSTVIGSGRHMRKVVSAEAVKKKKAVKVKDTSRRRRSLARRIVYGIKKMPMVMSIPFKGLKTGVDTITSDMTAHTGIGFNKSIVELLKIGQGSLSENATMPQVVRKKVNLTEIVRNKTYTAVMKFKDEHLGTILNSFKSELGKTPTAPAPVPDM